MVRFESPIRFLSCRALFLCRILGKEKQHGKEKTAPHRGTERDAGSVRTHSRGTKSISFEIACRNAETVRNATEMKICLSRGRSVNESRRSVKGIPKRHGTERIKERVAPLTARRLPFWVRSVERQISKTNRKENQMKTAVIYARYSSDTQTEQSIEGQLHVCEDYAKRKER